MLIYKFVIYLLYSNKFQFVFILIMSFLYKIIYNHIIIMYNHYERTVFLKTFKWNLTKSQVSQCHLLEYNTFSDSKFVEDVTMLAALEWRNHNLIDCKQKYRKDRCYIFVEIYLSMEDITVHMSLAGQKRWKDTCWQQQYTY